MEQLDVTDQGSIDIELVPQIKLMIAVIPGGHAPPWPSEWERKPRSDIRVRVSWPCPRRGEPERPSDGSKMWALGNVEAVAVARGTVDKVRAVGPRAASYLRGLDADERPIKGVHVDDPKAMFLFRWYQEVDANGTEQPSFSIVTSARPIKTRAARATTCLSTMAAFLLSG